MKTKKPKLESVLRAFNGFAGVVLTYLGSEFERKCDACGKVGKERKPNACETCKALFMVGVLADRAIAMTNETITELGAMDAPVANVLPC